MLTSRNRFHLYEIAQRTLCKQKGKRGERSREAEGKKENATRTLSGQPYWQRESIDRIISLNLRAEGTDTRGSRRRFLCHEMQSGPIPRLIDFVNATDRRAKEGEREREKRTLQLAPTIDDGSSYIQCHYQLVSCNEVPARNVINGYRSSAKRSGRRAGERTDG